MSQFHSGEILNKVKTNNVFEEKLTDEYINFVKNSNHVQKISLFHVTTAYGLNHYYINQKLILAGFPTAGGSNIITEKICPSKPVDSIERKLLLLPGPVVFLTACSLNHICNKVEFEVIAKKLQNLKLGFFGKKKNRSNKLSACFSKIDLKDENLNTVEIINTLMEFFISFDDFEKSYEEKL